MNIYIYTQREIDTYANIPQTKTACQGEGSYFVSILVSLNSRIARRQPTCLDLPGPAANNLSSRIACRQPTCLELPSIKMRRVKGREAFDIPYCLLPAAIIELCNLGK